MSTAVEDEGSQDINEHNLQAIGPDRNEIVANKNSVFVFDALDVERQPDAHTLYEAYLNLRCDFVKRMKWFDSRTDDTDVYDSPELTTKYFVDLRHDAWEDADEVIVGMRLTRVHGLRSSLSWSMLNEHMKEDILTNNAYDVNELNEIGKANNLWDLTRLVNRLDGSVGMRDTVESMLTVFGAGFGEMLATDYSDESPISWLFLTTPDIKRLLDRSGIHYRLIISGRVDVHDNEESYLCIVDPVESYHALAESDGTMHKRTFELVSRGLRNTHAL